jgi:hypothetical protein
MPLLKKDFIYFHLLIDSEQYPRMPLTLTVLATFDFDKRTGIGDTV